jgi:GntR family transcriptional repressor for pyruvate dehydrogenase complex
MPAPPVPPLARSTVVDQLTDSLIDAVVAGRFAVGAPLPPERELAEQLQVNRATLRQAVGRLEQIGLVARRQGSGTMVRDPAQLTAPEVVGRMATAQVKSFVADLLEVREALAGVIGRRAAGAITPPQREALEDLVAQMAAATTGRDRQMLELAFFAVLVDASGNRAIEVLLRWVEQVYENLTLPSVAPAFEEGPTVTEPLHALLEVIDRGGDLEAAMVGYARRSGERLLRAVAGT